MAKVLLVVSFRVSVSERETAPMMSVKIVSAIAEICRGLLSRAGTSRYDFARAH